MHHTSRKRKHAADSVVPFSWAVRPPTGTPYRLQQASANLWLHRQPRQNLVPSFTTARMARYYVWHWRNWDTYSHQHLYIVTTAQQYRLQTTQSKNNGHVLWKRTSFGLYIKSRSEISMLRGTQAKKTTWPITSQNTSTHGTINSSAHITCTCPLHCYTYHEHWLRAL